MESVKILQCARDLVKRHLEPRERCTCPGPPRSFGPDAGTGQRCNLYAPLQAGASDAVVHESDIITKGMFNHSIVTYQSVRSMMRSLSVIRKGVQMLVVLAVAVAVACALTLVQILVLRDVTRTLRSIAALLHAPEDN